MTTKKIAITGPESSGKSSLVSELAAHFNGTFTTEFARKFMEEFGTDYDERLIHFFITKQIEQEEIALQNEPQFLFCDTDLINFKIWLEHENLSVPDSLLALIKNPHYDFTLLLKPDISWEEDPLRQFPLKRSYFFERFEENLVEFKLPYAIIDGLGKTRTNNAIMAINNFYQN